MENNLLTSDYLITLINTIKNPILISNQYLHYVREQQSYQLSIGMSPLERRKSAAAPKNMIRYPSYWFYGQNKPGNSQFFGL